MILEVETKPLAEINTEALDILFEGLGPVNATRFLNQFSIGHGNYMAEKENLFGHLTMDELISDIKQQRVNSTL